MNPLAAYGVLAHGLIFGALVTLLPLGPLRARAGLIATTLALLGGIAPILHGNFGTPSATLLQLALLQLAGRAPTPPNARIGIAALLLIGIFYLLSLGLGGFDPYATGYAWPVLIVPAILGALLLRYRQTLWLLILAGDLMVFASGLFANFWDALFDPLLVLCLAIFILVPHLRRRGRAQQEGA